MSHCGRVGLGFLDAYDDCRNRVHRPWGSGTHVQYFGGFSADALATMDHLGVMVLVSTTVVIITLCIRHVALRALRGCYSSLVSPRLLYYANGIYYLYVFDIICIRWPRSCWRLDLPAVLQK